jgi:hypothetical protein
MKRYLIYPLQFDTRPQFLDEAGEHWDAEVKRLHIQNREGLIASLRNEFGGRAFKQKLKNFRDLGSSPFSIGSHHNAS